MKAPEKAKDKPVNEAAKQHRGASRLGNLMAENELLKAALAKKEHETRERIKELNCLYGISKIIEKEGNTISGIMMGIVNLLPPAWQYPDIACGRIVWEDREFKTVDFQEAPWMLSHNIIVHGKPMGRVEVFYREEREGGHGGPFLHEEYSLIEAIAERLGKIIERKEAAKAWQATFDSLQDMVIFLDTSFNIVQANDSAISFFKLPREEVVGRPCYSLMHGTDAPLVGCPLTKMIISKNHEETEVYEDHRGVWLSVSADPVIDGKGNIAGCVHIVKNITGRKQVETALKESEERLRTIIETEPECVKVLDNNGKLMEMNTAGLSMLEAQSMQDVMLCGLENFLLPAYRANFLTTLKHVSGGEQKTMEFEIVGLKGTRRWIEMHAAPMRDGNGNITRILAVARDITERKKAEAVLQKSHDELEQRVRERTQELEAANKELESFSYSVSHDLRAPLRAIDGYAQILVEDYLDKLDNEGRRFLNVIQSETKVMGRLIDELLRFSRLGRQSLKMVPIDMTVLVKEVFEQLRFNASHHSVTLHLDALPPTLGDFTLLRQVWINLIGNALKFTKDREDTLVQIQGFSKEKEVIYSIQDNGVGFNMQFANKLFGVFQRLHGQDEFEGTGVGLALVQRIIHRHGGRIWAEAEVGKGAAFFFALPQKEGGR